MAATPERAPASAPPIDTEPTNTPDKFSYRNATFEEVLEDLSSRFILNLPEDELAEVERVCFQVEQAHWYYEDFIRDDNPSFPSLPLKKFSEILFRSCPLLHHWSHDHETAFNGFMSYKTRVPVCGAIMLNEALTKCVLVKGWKSSAGWGFPKGKINEDEDEAFCAVREVLEETGYSLSGQIRRTECIRLCIKQQPITLFVVPCVPEDFPFKTQTRKEISKIDWFKLADLPTWKKNPSSTNKFYLITPVIGPLKVMVRTLRKTRKAAKTQRRTIEVAQSVVVPEADHQAEVDEAIIGVKVESLVTIEHEPSAQSQSGEAEISSSQSSSIDPHTPSVNGDLAPHMSDDTLVVKHHFSRDADDIPVDADMNMSIEAMSSAFNADSHTHWSRLMTRLNHSEENSPRATSKASTPTPPTAPNSTRPELHPPEGSTPSRARTITGSALVEPSNPEQSDAPVPHRVLRRHPNVVRPSSISSFPLGSGASGISTSFALLGRAPPLASPDQTPSSDVMVKRTKQLQLLNAVLAEESDRRTPQPAPPMSAHILGAYPRPSSELVPAQVRPIRPTSVNPETLRSLSTLSRQHKHPVSSLSGVLPSPTPPPLQPQFIRAPQGHLPQHQPSILTHTRGSVTIVPEGRPATVLPSQLHFTLQAPQGSSLPGSPLAASPYDRDTSVDSSHRGQMLSILSGGGKFRPTTSGTSNANFRSTGTPHRPGAVSSSSSHGSFSSTSTVASHPMVSAPRGANVHLLSILNTPSPAGRSSPAPAMVHARE